MKKFLILFITIFILFCICFILIRVLTNEIRISGVIELPLSSWSPAFDRECFGPSPIIRHLGNVYYLVGICKFRPDKLIGKKVIVTGVIEKRELDTPLYKKPNAPTEKKVYIVINVKNIKLRNQ